MILGIECWFAQWARYDAQFESVGGAGASGDKPVNGTYQTRVFSLLPEMLKGLAALSVLGDQYHLVEDTERDWMEWMQGLETCWLHWKVQQKRSNERNRQQGQGRGQGHPEPAASPAV